MQLIFIILASAALLLLLTSLLFLLELTIVGRSKRNRKAGRYDAIIVLGFPAGRGGRPSPVMRKRVIKAAELYALGYAGRLIFTGGGVYNRFVEADVMADFAGSLGVPEQSVIRETASRSTFENIQNSIQIMNENGWRTAVVVTSPWHIPRTFYLLSETGLPFSVAKSRLPKELRLITIWAYFLWENINLLKMVLRRKNS